MAKYQQSIRSTIAALPYEKRMAFQRAMHDAQDCPIVPTSELDPTPMLPEGAGDKLTPQQRLAAAALIAGQSFSAAARAAGCGRRTLFKWRQQPVFEAAVNDISREALDVAIVRVRNLMLRATRVLGESMLDRPDAATHAFRVLNSARLWTTAQSSTTPGSKVDPSAAGDSSDAETEPPVDPAEVVPVAT